MEELAVSLEHQSFKYERENITQNILLKKKQIKTQLYFPDE